MAVFNSRPRRDASRRVNLRYDERMSAIGNGAFDAAAKVGEMQFADLEVRQSHDAVMQDDWNHRFLIGGLRMSQQPAPDA